MLQAEFPQRRALALRLIRAAADGGDSLAKRWLRAVHPRGVSVSAAHGVIASGVRCGQRRFHLRYAPIMNQVSYSSRPFGGPTHLVIFGVTAVVGSFVIFAPRGSQPGPGPLFDVAWFAILLWNAYWFLFRISYHVELEDNQIRWFTPLRRGEFLLGDFVSIGAPLLAFRVSIFKCNYGPSAMIIVGRGLDKFAAEVQQRSPAVRVSTETYERFERRSAWNGFRRGK